MHNKQWKTKRNFCQKKRASTTKKVPDQTNKSLHGADQIEKYFRFSMQSAPPKRILALSLWDRKSSDSLWKLRNLLPRF